MDYPFYFVSGSQDLYGEECIRHVKEHSIEIVDGLNKSKEICFPVEYKGTMLTSSEIADFFNKANSDKNCAGIILWMHTFSPAKNWIKGLKICNKPICHLHTQFNRDLPFSTIDMDFMNENQSAHGDREFGYIMTRMNIPREVIVGHWKSPDVCRKIGSWMKSAIGVVASSDVRICRFADNMRSVAVTEGDKIEAQIKFGWTVDTYSINDVAKYVENVSSIEIKALTDEYYVKYKILDDGRNLDELRKSVEVQAAIEIGFERFLKEHNYNAVVTHFDDLGSLKQLPGLAMQRLMEKGYGFGAEGDWKTAGLVRLMKVMSQNHGTSFFEDYTYNLAEGEEAVLESHMLEVCPTVASGEISIRVCPLTMGGKEDPARLVFTSRIGSAIAVSMIDLGSRFRLIVSEVDCIPVPEPMPRLPVASAYWRPRPDLSVGAEAWILAGGAHHTAFSYEITSSEIASWAEYMGIECVVIGKDTKIADFKDRLKWNSAFYR